MTRYRRPPPERVDEPLRWLRANRHDLGALTGTDTRALLAIAACWRLYFNADDQTSVLRAVVELLASLQPKCWRLAKALIPWAGDWSHEDPVWRTVAGMVSARDEARTRRELSLRMQGREPDQDPITGRRRRPAPWTEAEHREALQDIDRLRQPRVEPGRSYTDVPCPECHQDAHNPCVGVRHDEIHRARFFASRAASRRDPEQCIGENDDGSPCRGDKVAGVALCARHLLETVPRCKCSAHEAPCSTAIDDDHPSGLCLACRRECRQ